MEEKAKVGVEDISEIVVASMEITLHLMKYFKDGFQTADVLQLISDLQTDTEYREKLLKAYDGYSKVPEQARDFDALEVTKLITDVLTYVPKMIEIFKKKD